MNCKAERSDPRQSIDTLILNLALVFLIKRCFVRVVNDENLSCSGYESG